MATEQTPAPAGQGGTPPAGTGQPPAGAGQQPAGEGQQPAGAGTPDPAKAGAGQDGGKPPAAGAKEGDKPKDGEADKGKQTGAPEKYEAFKVPEGINVDATELEQFHGLAKEFGLTQEAAQKLVDFEAGRVQKALASTTKFWTEKQKEWVDTAKSDKEYGGADFEKSQGVVRKALEAFAKTPEELKAFDDAINYTGIGNHPEFVRLLYRIGLTVGEGKPPLAGNKPGEGPKSQAERIFPNQGSK